MSLSAAPALLLSPSLIAASPLDLEGAVRLAERVDCISLHIDLMDGHFVPNLTYGPNLIAAVRPITSLFLDVHLLVNQPMLWITKLIESGADAITVHVEATPDWRDCLTAIKAQDCQAGIALNPQTDLSFVHAADWQMIDRLIIMTVNPGFSGQVFLEDMWPKIHQAAVLKLQHPHLYITVDGGVTDSNIARLAQAGIDTAIIGSAFYQQTDPIAAYQNLIARMQGSVA